ncbi:MAG: histidinol dehydrogenase, partial [Planctomycetes bacterium]|nr:histidinol dehydrogenase [Planctomycetota bacterium]
MNAPLLQTVAPHDIPRRRGWAVDLELAKQAGRIVDQVRTGGEAALRRYAERFDGLSLTEPLVFDRAELQTAWQAVSDDVRSLLQRTADRIRRFAGAQRSCLTELRFEIPGGAAGRTTFTLKVENPGTQTIDGLTISFTPPWLEVMGVAPKQIAPGVTLSIPLRVSDEAVSAGPS